MGAYLENQHGRIIDRGSSEVRNPVYCRLNVKRSFERGTLQCRTLLSDTTDVGEGSLMNEVKSPRKKVLLISSWLERDRIESYRFP